MIRILYHAPPVEAFQEFIAHICKLGAMIQNSEDADDSAFREFEEILGERHYQIHDHYGGLAYTAQWHAGQPLLPTTTSPPPSVCPASPNSPLHSVKSLDSFHSFKNYQFNLTGLSQQISRPSCPSTLSYQQPPEA